MHNVHHEDALLKTQARRQLPGSFKRWLGTSAAALVLSTLALPMVAQSAPTDAPASIGKHGGCGERGGSGGFAGHHGGLPLRALNLSSDQQAQVDQIRAATEPKAKENGKTIHTNMKALRNLEMAPQFDQAKAESLSQGIGQAVAANTLLRAQANQQIYQLLTADQRKKLDAMRKQFEEGKGRGKPPGE